MELVSVRETEWQKTEKAISAVTWSIWHCARVILPFHIVSKSSLIVNYIYSLNCPNFIVQDIATLLLCKDKSQTALYYVSV